ncbi:MAG: hypothetical protein ACM319_05040 [Deltaproteobacteria bacterium]
MIRVLRFTLAVALLVASTWGIAAAELTFSVNDSNTGVFDQPNATFLGPPVYVVFIGGDTVSGPFRVFFAAVNGGADFTNLQLARDSTVLPIPPVAIDNTGAGGNSPYFDARHPKVVLRTASEAVILFQARPTAADTVYRPYLARVAFTATTASPISVQQITGFPAGILSTGDIEDLSVNLVPADGTARMAFAIRDAIASAAPFHVYYARVGLDTATIVGTPLLLSSGTNDTVTGSDGFRPIPSLRLDGLNRSHVAWAANNSTAAASGVYYALVNSTATGDSVAIGATEVLGRTLAWGHPAVVTFTANGIAILAVDESVPGKAGSMGFVNINPDAAVQNGLPVSIGIDRSFLLFGPTILPATFDQYRPEVYLDILQQIHIDGYGSSGTLANYYAIATTGELPFVNFAFATIPVSVGLGTTEPPTELPGDYTRATFAVLTRKTIAFWSGQIPGSANRNLDFTSVANNSYTPAVEEGCSMVEDPRAGETERIPGVLLLFLPAAVLALRRIRISIRRRFGRGIAD